MQAYHMCSTVLAVSTWDVRDAAACVNDSGVGLGWGPQQQLGIEIPAHAADKAFQLSLLQSPDAYAGRYIIQ